MGIKFTLNSTAVGSADLHPGDQEQIEIKLGTT